MGANTQTEPQFASGCGLMEGDPSFFDFLKTPDFVADIVDGGESQHDEFADEEGDLGGFEEEGQLRLVAEQVAELVLTSEDNKGDFDSSTLESPTRPEWQKLCIQHSVCIHNIYGNCAYGSNCYYHHLEDFKKPDLLYKTELCRYGSDCVNRPRCCFAHSRKERRTPELNVNDALRKNHVHPNMGPSPQRKRLHQQQQQHQFEQALLHQQMMNQQLSPPGQMVPQHHQMQQHLPQQQLAQQFPPHHHQMLPLAAGGGGGAHNQLQQSTMVGGPPQAQHQAPPLAHHSNSGNIYRSSPDFTSPTSHQLRTGTPSPTQLRASPELGHSFSPSPVNFLSSSEQYSPFRSSPEPHPPPPSSVAFL